MGINFSSSEAELKHLNIRKEGPEDMPVTAIDLKINCETAGDCLPSLLGCDDQPDFWLDNEDRDVRFTGIEQMKSWAVFESHELNFGGLKLPLAKLKNFSFRPIAGGLVDLTFSASITEPSERQVNILVEMVRESSAVQVVAPPDLFDEEQEQAA